MFQGKSAVDGRTQQGNKALNEKRIHPTQKPVILYEWILSRYAKRSDKILDTHAGSASSLVACRKNGFNNYVGFEIDERYYKMARARLQAEENQINIWDIIEVE